eukprot:CAMPEP_0182867044 /NCGR_PEP_ID=MMETSP0034_2-20130328/8511_1 /TAXON_ID=156128 /ORGANISM="Nephroselmis pyriformis, Strain CCMP717" /LENGTH=226 /DNA_ID=CAMNT_0024999379 /DNA_START=401 /DNA_END=1082 /DNA_ORIENTATION=-
MSPLAPRLTPVIPAHAPVTVRPATREEGVPQRLPRRQPGLRVVVQHPLEQVGHGGPERRAVNPGHDARQRQHPPHRPDALPGRPLRPYKRIVRLEILGRGNLLVCQLGYACRNRPEDRLHHSQVLEVVMGLKQRLACEELEQDASDAPDITRVGPPQTEDDFRRSVVPRRHDAAVVLIVEGCIPEVDELDLAAHRHPHRAGPRWARLFGVIVRHQQDVLWFEIRVH